MIRSIRGRLQAWYALVLFSAIAGFAGLLYYQVRTARFHEIDRQLISSAQYLDAALKSFPPGELERQIHWPPRDGDFAPHPERGGPPRDGEFMPYPERGGLPQRDGLPQGDGPPQRDGLPQGGGSQGSFPSRGPAPRHGGPAERPPMHAPFERQPGPFPPARREQLYQELGLPAMSEAEADWTAAAERYFAVWRADGSLLKASLAAEQVPRVLPLSAPPAGPPGALPRVGEREGHRQVLLAGPRGTRIIVGQPIGQELADLRAFAWQLAASGSLVLLTGLAGGWLLSRRIVRPLAAMSQTAASISAHNLSGRIDTRDIDSELAELAGVLNATFARLEAQFERQARFTADASHELRTPLAILHNSAELALARPRSQAEYRQTLSTCLETTRRMRSLVDGLLILARSDAGSLALDPRPLDLGAVVEDAVALYQPQALAAGVRLSAALAARGAVVAGNRAFLARVLENLLANALRHTPAGGQVHVSLGIENRQAVLTVSDTGTGIPIEEQPRIFERFHRVDKARSRATGGCGLGLAITKSLVEAHGGSIGFRSQPASGTSFVVRLPLAPAAAAPLGEPAAARPAGLLSGPPGGGGPAHGADRA